MIRLVNKSKCDGEINLHNGETAKIQPFSYIVLKGDLTEEITDYYSQLRDLGIYVEQIKETVAKEAVATSEAEIPSVPELMKLTKTQLISRASELGLGDLTALPKREICNKIVGKLNEGK